VCESLQRMRVCILNFSVTFTALSMKIEVLNRGGKFVSWFYMCCSQKREKNTVFLILIIYARAELNANIVFTCPKTTYVKL